MFVGVYNRPLAVTMLGMVLALGAIFLGSRGVFHLAWICFMYAGIADLFDGFIARRMKMSRQESEFGVQIDSLVDVVSFGITPVTLVMFLAGSSWITFLGGGFYLFAALMRLAWFNISGTTAIAGKKYYTGLPVTYASLILPLVAIGLPQIGKLIPLDGVVVYQISWSLVLVIIGLLFLSKIKVPKPGGIFYILFPLLAVALTLVFLLGGRT